MRGYSLTLVTVAALASYAPVAHAQVPLEVEGPIVDIVPNGNGGAIITVMGMEIEIPAGTPISSPTKQLTVTQLLNQTPLPGRSQPGFVGGTAIITGVSEPGDRIADDVFVEPAENVVLGQITGPMEIEDMPFALIDDARIPASPIRNAFGFAVQPNSLVAGTPASLEGYYSLLDSVFHAFLVEVEGGTLVNAGVREVSVLRADCRQRTNGQLEIEVRGATHNPATGTVSITNVANTIVYGTATVTPDAEDPNFGTYRFTRRASGLGTCQTQIAARFGTAVTIAPQDVRID